MTGPMGRAEEREAARDCLGGGEARSLDKREDAAKRREEIELE
jgi:hypothetical protein